MTKVKFILEQAMKTHRGNRGIVIFFSYPRRQMGWFVNATPCLVYPRETDPVPII